MSDAASRGQVSRSAADIYEEFFVPALFAEWPPRLLDAAGVTEGQDLLDVGCGTGIVARAALPRVGEQGSVTGLDPNEGMLAVAKRIEPAIDWREGVAEALPFDDASFDIVTSQFTLMFFEDRSQALAEMYRVLRPGGRLAIAVWDALEHTPGYEAMVGLLNDLFGETEANALRAPFCLGDPAEVTALFKAAKIPDASLLTLDGKARFNSVADWVHTDVHGWTLDGMLDDTQYERLVNEAARVMQPFVGDDGKVEFAAPAHIVTATRM